MMCDGAVVDAILLVAYAILCRGGLGQMHGSR